MRVPPKTRPLLATHPSRRSTQAPHGRIREATSIDMFVGISVFFGLLRPGGIGAVLLLATSVTVLASTLASGGLWRRPLPLNFVSIHLPILSAMTFAGLIGAMEGNDEAVFLWLYNVVSLMLFAPVVLYYSGRDPKYLLRSLSIAYLGLCLVVLCEYSVPGSLAFLPNLETRVVLDITRISAETGIFILYPIHLGYSLLIASRFYRFLSFLFGSILTPVLMLITSDRAVLPVVIVSSLAFVLLVKMIAQSRATVKQLVILSSLSVVAALAVGPSLGLRISSLFGGLGRLSGGQGDLDGKRVDQVIKIIELWSHRPLQGYGFGAEVQVGSRLLTELEVTTATWLLHYGLIGLSLLMFSYALCIREAGKLLLSRSDDSIAAGTAIAAVIVAFVSTSTNPLLSNVDAWWVVTPLLAIASRGVYKSERIY